MVASAQGLDPSDWQGFRAQAHRMLDDILDFSQDIRQRPVWQPTPPGVAQARAASLPEAPSELADVHQQFLTEILPYTCLNAHPAFMGWVQGGGTAVGMVADMLAAGLNANVGGRQQAPVELERQVCHWMRDLFGFPTTASGLFVTGTSMANLMAVLVARHRAAGPTVRQQGVPQTSGKLVAYTSSAAHGCVAQAMDLCGLGTNALRRMPVNAAHQMDLAALEAQIEQDKAAGLTPFLVIGTAGSVDVGAVDELHAIARLARAHDMWFHVDGAYGALGMLSPAIAPLLRGIEEADSIAFDFHKWGQVPYDAGFLLVRDGQAHQATFAAPAAYLRRECQGPSAGTLWPCDLGPDLSRGFRALKTWFTFKVYGSARLGQVIAGTCELAQALAQRVRDEPRLELLAPVTLNIVCFRYRCAHPDHVNAQIVLALQSSGVCLPSSTMVEGRFAIRAAIVNHRTTMADIDTLLQATLAEGDRLTMSQAAQGEQA